MYNILIVILISLSAQLCLCKDKTCNMTIDDADQCTKKIMFIGDRDNIIPSNDQEMETYCGRMKEGIRCIRQYARGCLPPFPQQVFGMFAYDAKNMLRQQCKEPKDRAVFLKHVQCFLPKPAMDPLHLCMDKYILDLDIIHDHDPNWRIPGICCSFHLMQECIHKSTQTLCDSKTGADTVDYIMTIINSMTDDVLDFTCGQYDSIERCDKHYDPESWSLMKAPKDAATIAAERAKQKHFSPIPGIVNVITNFEM